MILSVNNIKKSYNGKTVLEKITFGLEEGEKAAVCGVNGAGKTTLFKIISGDISPDDGEVIIPKDVSFGMLSQEIAVLDDLTLYEEMLSVFKPVLLMEEKISGLSRRIPSLKGPELDTALSEYDSLRHEFERCDGYSIKSRISGVLKGLGFDESLWHKSFKTLSGGQKTLAALSKLLLQKPKLLLLDEPTNHLDISAASWLEDYIRLYPGTVVIISHDRYFLDRTVTKVIGIENGKSFVCSGNYTAYAKFMEQHRLEEKRDYAKKIDEIKRQEEIIVKLRSFNREKSIKRAESREKLLKKLPPPERPQAEPEKIRLKLTPKIESGTDVLFAEGVSKSFGDKKLFENVCLDIKKGDKTAILGPNGIGKTTLLKIIMNALMPDSGFLRFGTNVNIGYYDQEKSSLSPDKTIFDEISDAYPALDKLKIRNTLASFAFTGDDVFKKISELSGGESGRVLLAKIMLSSANLLILDEPTNHLDIFSMEALENAVLNYTGTVVYVSHDRYFIDKTAEIVLELTKNGIIKYPGNYSYYLEKKKTSLEESPEKAETESETRKAWLKTKQKQAEDRRIKNALLRIEKEIEEKENKIKELEGLLFTDEISRNAEKSKSLFDDKTKLEAELLDLLEEWESLQ